MRIYPSAPNLVVVRINNRVGSDYSGDYSNYYSRVPATFKMLGELLLQLEHFYNDINYPQASNNERTFSKKMNRNNSSNESANNRKEIEKVQNQDELLSNKGEIATFVIHVQYRQNASWQGKILWAEKNEERSFRSALEMIKLMDNAIESTSDEQK